MYEYKDLNYLKNNVKTDLKKGLNQKEAESRLKVYGENILEDSHKQNYFKVFINQLKDPMIYILLVGIAISAFLREFSDCIVIIVVVLLNALIGMFQEVKTEKSLEMLKKISSNKVCVVRDGQRHLIDSKELVVGDLVILESGNSVGADLRIIHSEGLKIDESSLTGESKAVNKSSELLSENITTLGDKTNLAYMSTLVVSGKGKGIVIATGMKSEIGRIAKLLKEKKTELSPLQTKLARLGKLLGLLVVGVCLLLFFVALLEKRDVLDMLLSSISLAVAAIPEGLPTVVTIVLALGVQKMSKMNALVKRLHSVESLGSVNIICSDKTGTITENKLKCESIYENGVLLNASEMKLSELSLASFLCNNSYLDGNKWQGSSIECELKRITSSLNININMYERLEEKEFNSSRKMMSTLNVVGGRKKQYTKGAFDRIIDKCNYQLINGKKELLTERIKLEIKKIIDQKSLEGKRILAFAKKDDVNKITEENMVFLGFLTFFDPPREGVKESVATFKKAGIETRMITGDYLQTAYSIAKSVGIVSEIDECISGEELNNLEGVELDRTIASKKVFARVSPEHKTKIVESLKGTGNVVAMTGDGVNDAPSLKKADIGISMGINGSDVAKEASDIILLDDDFSTIKVAIKEGRKIYENLRKTILFLLSSNFAEIIVMVVGIVLSFPLPLLAIHILIVNLLTDSIPALCLGIDSVNDHIMERKPNNKKEGLFSNGGIIRIFIYGVIIALLTFIAYLIPSLSEGFKLGVSGIDIITTNERVLLKSQTYAFVVLSISELFCALAARDLNRSVYRKDILNNKYMNWAIVLGVLVTMALIFTPASSVLKFSKLSVGEFAFLILISLCVLAMHELVLIGFHMKQRKLNK